MTKAILAGASAIALLAISNGASATTVLNSGGGTLAAKVYRDIFNCYSTTAKSTTGYANGFYSTSATSTAYASVYGTQVYPTFLNYPKTENSDCSASTYFNPAHTEAIDYLPVGSGAGQNAFTSATPSWGTPAEANPVAWLNTHLGITDLAEAEVEFDFSGSDAYLTATQIASASTTHGTVIQFPGLLTPIDLTYNTTSGGSKVELKVTDVCGIFGGTITNWSQVTGVAGTNTGPITVVVRADSSGTSFIFSDYLAKVCPTVGSYPGFTAANGFPKTTPSWSAAAVANGGSAANFISASGSGGVAGAVNNTANSINYISPDYVGKAGGEPNTKAASVQIPNGTKNYTGTAVYAAPSSTTIAELAAGVTAPQTTDAYSWGQPVNDGLAELAENGKGASYPKSAYPIGGFSFFETYACPANPTSVSNLFTWYFNSSGPANANGYTFVTKLLASRGFSSVPANFQSAINSYLIPEIGSGC
jgi:ABC-type phosphate transport system substrate-binding protein